MTGTENKVETIQKEEIVDNLESTDNKPKVDEAKLAALKALAAKKKAEEEGPKEESPGDDMPINIVQERKRSWEFGIVGSGHAGSKIAQAWYELGYPAVVMNTAQQDLTDIKIPECNKLLLEAGLGGGAAKDLTIGGMAAEAYAEAIEELVSNKLSNCNFFIFCTSLGGGSGAGSVNAVVEVLHKFGKPVIVLGVLPKDSEDALLKHNAWQTLSKLTKCFNEGKIDNIIIVDNAKIESVYSDVNPFAFFEVSNKAIVECIDTFNRLSVRKSEGAKVLDSAEFGKLFIDGKGFTTYGSMRVENYTDEMSIATALVESLGGNLLASGMDIKQARYAGFMLVAPERVWDQIPSSAIDYANHIISDFCESPLSVYQGIYKEKSQDDCIKVYSMFSGLGIPTERVNQLQAEAKQRMDKVRRKDEDRKLTMKVDVGEETVNKAAEIRQRIQNNNSSLSKLQNSLIQDRRKK